WEEPAVPFGTTLSDVLVVDREDLFAQLVLAHDVEAEQALREDQLFLDAFDVEVAQTSFDFKKAGIALEAVVENLGDLGRRHRLAFAGELEVAVPLFDAGFLVAQMLGEF